MKTVLVNITFRDAYTGEIRIAGKTYQMSEERVKEVKEVNPNFVTVVGNVTQDSVVESDVPAEALVEEISLEESKEVEKNNRKK